MDAATIDVLKGRMEAEAARTAPPEGFPRMPAIPTGRYTDPGFFALEREHFWSKCWLLAAHKDELPEVGAYRLWDRLGLPILVVRSGEDDYRALQDYRYDLHEWERKERMYEDGNDAIDRMLDRRSESLDYDLYVRKYVVQD